MQNKGLLLCKIKVNAKVQHEKKFLYKLKKFIYKYLKLLKTKKYVSANLSESHVVAASLDNHSPLQTRRHQFFVTIGLTTYHTVFNKLN